LEPIDFFETGSKLCSSFYPELVISRKKNIEFLSKEGGDPIFPFSCNTRKVLKATLSTVITALMGE
jgi:hypothetical protein